MNKYLKALLISIGLMLVSIGLPFLILGITYWTSSALFPYPLLMAILLTIYGLTSYLIGDIFLYRYRKKEDLIVTDTPKEIKDKAMDLRRPFIYATIGTGIAFAVILIIFLCNGQHWPIIG